MIQQLDNKILTWSNQLVGQSNLIDDLLIFFAQWLVYLVPLILLVSWFWLKFGKRFVHYLDIRMNLLEIVLVSVVGWQIVSRMIKFFYFRPRPYASDQPIEELFFHRPDESFPSDHTILLFAISTYCYLLGWKRIGSWTLGAAILVSAARVITGIHWASDVIGGIVIGVMTAYLVWKIRTYLIKLLRPLINLVERIGL